MDLPEMGGEVYRRIGKNTVLDIPKYWNIMEYPIFTKGLEFKSVEESYPPAIRNLIPSFSFSNGPENYPSKSKLKKIFQSMGIYGKNIATRRVSYPPWKQMDFAQRDPALQYHNEVIKEMCKGLKTSAANMINQIFPDFIKYAVFWSTYDSGYRILEHFVIDRQFPLLKERILKGNILRKRKALIDAKKLINAFRIEVSIAEDINRAFLATLTMVDPETKKTRTMIDPDIWDIEGKEIAEHMRKVLAEFQTFVDNEATKSIFSIS